MNTLVLAIGLLSLAIIVLAILLVITMKRIKELTRGESTGSLESIIKNNNSMLLDVNSKIQHQAKQIISIQKDAMKNIQNVGVIRFNPFKETGGSQSFAIALTDKNNNGVVLSSLYARERINVFAKPITTGTSEYTLSDEEQKALIQSQNTN